MCDIQLTLRAAGLFVLLRRSSFAPIITGRHCAPGRKASYLTALRRPHSKRFGRKIHKKVNHGTKGSPSGESMLHNNAHVPALTFAWTCIVCKCVLVRKYFHCCFRRNSSLCFGSGVFNLKNDACEYVVCCVVFTSVECQLNHGTQSSRSIEAVDGKVTPIAVGFEMR